MMLYFLYLTIPATLLVFGLGGFFLYDSVSTVGASSLPEVIIGASLLSLGLVLLHRQVQDVVRWVRWTRTENHRQ